MFTTETTSTRGEDIARKITGAVSVFAIACVLIGAIVIAADVVIRWLFNTSIFALNEILSVVFAFAVAATLPAGAAYRVNLKLDLLASMTSARANAWLKAFGAVFLLGFFATIGATAYRLGLRKLAQGEETSLLYIDLHPVYFAVAVAMVVSVLAQIINIRADIKAALATPKGETRTSWIVWVIIAVLVIGMGGIGAIAVIDPSALTKFVLVRPATTVLIGFALLWLGVLTQIPLATVTAALGILGCLPLIGWTAATNTMTQEAIDFLLNPQVATLPLFLIMGAFSVVAGISSDLFNLGNALLGRFRGGLAYATVAACAGFGAVSGNSLVTSATFGRMAMPEMKKLGYTPTLSTGTVAAGGTLGALVPPSGVIILFAILTKASIGDLFIAALIPAALALALYFAAIFAYSLMNAEAAPASRSANLAEIRGAFVAAGPVLAMFAVVIGGLYGGLFTITESAAVGAVCAFLLALFRGRLNRKSLLSVFAETTSTVAMIYGLIFGGLIFGFAVNLTGAPDAIGAVIAGLDAKPIVILAVLIVIYLLLGSVMDSFGVMIITLPVVTPIVLDLGYDILFWGVLMLVVVEVGLITPPFGMNLFILKSIDPDQNLGTVMKGVMPFVMADVVKIILLVGFPALALWLPSTM